MALSGMALMLKSMGVDMNEVNQALQVIPAAVQNIVSTLQRIESKQDNILSLLRTDTGVITNGRNDDNRPN